MTHEPNQCIYFEFKIKILICHEKWPRASSFVAKQTSQKMSHSRKHVTEKVLNDFPVPVEPQFIGRCVALKGNNIVQVENNKGEQFSAMIPQKFHKLVWITRGIPLNLCLLTTQVHLLL